METTTIYRIISFEGKTAEEMDHLMNTFLRDEADITPVNVSTSVVSAKEEMLYTATLLYSFKD